METFGQRVRSARKAMKLTQVELAKRVKMSQGNLSDIENGHVPTSTHTPLLAEVLGVNAAWLATGKRDRFVGHSETERSENYVTGVSPSSNSKAREPATEYVAREITYEVIRRVVSGALQGLGVRYEDLVADDAAARQRIEAVLTRSEPKFKNATYDEILRITGSEIVKIKDGIVEMEGSTGRGRKKKPA